MANRTEHKDTRSLDQQLHAAKEEAQWFEERLNETQAELAQTKLQLSRALRREAVLARRLREQR